MLNKDLNISNYLKNYGLLTTIKIFLRYLGIRTYTRIKYPSSKFNFKIKVHIKYFNWKNFEKGQWDFKNIQFLCKFIEKGKIILDVGAWVGVYTILFAKLVGKSGKIYAFEPDFKAFKVLSENMCINNLNNVRIEKIGISNSIGREKLHLIDGGGRSTSSLLKLKNNGDINYEIIHVNTIDRYCKINNIIPDIIKIDVEGAENLVLEGCKNIIAEYSPWIILEFHSKFMNDEIKNNLWNKIIQSAKYIIFISGIPNSYRYGSKIKSLPNCEFFNILIKF